ncbi:hypothetical protein SAMN05421780_11053 [Flexibacter flexilis DSM 6793]|uniref:Uncharacterized protein n=1 Tax=Flexibacter flexilis DSM 6793 TaxID=927664 RepID=A0A1I1MEF0_9BACT|nr:hypothetical protein SAMN05421780_11053 [Flexibacter flexilis DSM 6793]
MENIPVTLKIVCQLLNCKNEKAGQKIREVREQLIYARIKKLNQSNSELMNPKAKPPVFLSDFCNYHLLDYNQCVTILREKNMI